MAGPDIATKVLAKDTSFFADVFNTFVFGGKQVINHNDLVPVDTTMSVVMEKRLKATMPIDKLDDSEKEKFFEYLEKMYGKPEDDKSSDFPFWMVTYSKIRDVLMMGTEGNSQYCIWGIENQTVFDASMLLRMMLYDVLDLYLRAEGKFNFGPNDERTGQKISLQEKLAPVCSVVLYWGNDKNWEGTYHLEDFLDPNGLALLGGTYNLSYTMTVINARKMYEKIGDMHDVDLKTIATYLKSEEEGKKQYPKVSQKVADAYRSLLGKEIKENEFDGFVSEEGDINMAEYLMSYQDLKTNYKDLESNYDMAIKTLVDSALSSSNGNLSAEEAIAKSGYPDDVKNNCLKYIKKNNL